jgi:hypothetical protein
MQLCCRHFQRYLAGKEKFFIEMRRLFHTAEGLDVCVKGLVQRWEKIRRREVANDTTKSGVARHYGEFELAMDKWLQFVDTARGIFVVGGRGPDGGGGLR